MSNTANKLDLSKLEKWTRPRYYIGPDHDGYILIGRNRDSDILTNCNFDVALNMMGGESDHVEVIRDSHWAVGWVEYILVASDAPVETLAKAVEIVERLDDYPILDESEYSEAEHEYINETFEQNKDSIWSDQARNFGLTKEQAEEIEGLDDFENCLYAFYTYSCMMRGTEDGWCIDFRDIKAALVDASMMDSPAAKAFLELVES